MIKKNCMLLFLGTVLAVSCSKDLDEEVIVTQNSEKQLTSFKFLAASNEALSVDVTGNIDEDKKEVGIELPFGTPLTALVPTIGFTAGAAIDPQAAETDFGGDVVYTITAADGSTAEYTVKVTVAGSGEKQLTSFKFLAASNEALSVDVTGDILPDNIVEVGVPFGTPLTALVPTIGFTAGAAIDPQAAETDFSGDVVYTITAADGSTAEYTVKVTVAGSGEKQLTSFKFLAVSNEALSVDVTGNIDEDKKEVGIEVPFGTPLTALVPTIGFTAGATIDPQAAETDFSGDVAYTITAADGSTAQYTVKVSVAAGSSEKQLTSFKFLAVSNEALSVDVTGDILPDNTVEVEVPFGTPLTALVPTIGFTAGATIDPQAAETDFSGDVVYTITAADESTAEYTVKVTVAGSGEKQLTSFKFLAVSNEALSVDVTGNIDEEKKEVGIEVPFGTPLTALVPTIGFTAGAAIDPQAAETDFSGDVVYTITAADGSTAQYTVKVTVAAGSSEKQLTSFKFLASDNEGALSVDVTGDILPDNIVEVEVPFGTPLTALVPTIGFTAGATIDPQAAETDFSGDVVYTITAADGSTAQYTVKVTVAAGSSEKQLTSFKFLAVSNEALSVDVTGDILPDNTVEVEVPFGTPLTALVPTIGFTAGATIDPQAAETDFSGDVVYTITAADGSTAQYTVKVTVAAGSSEKQLTSFKFLAVSNEALSVDVTGDILPDNTVEVEVPFGTPLTALVPTIGFTAGATIDPQAAETDFSGDVTYTIIAEDGSTAEYTVKVTVAAGSSEKQLTSFKFLAVSNEALSVDVTGDILPDNTVEVEVPFGTPLTALVPTIGFTAGAAIDPEAAETDFSGDVTYTIMAEDGSTANYTVTVEQAQTDRQVLEDIFRSNRRNTLGATWQVDNPDSDISTWEGVYVDADGRVVELFLGDKLIAVLPASIGNLEKLTELDLSSNELTEIPISIGNLRNLKILFLSSNSLTTIPQTVCDLKNTQNTVIFSDIGVSCQ